MDRPRNNFLREVREVECRVEKHGNPHHEDHGGREDKHGIGGGSPSL